jgi:superfamily II DNA/RNA helicase
MANENAREDSSASINWPAKLRSKLGIERLNPMQEAAVQAIDEHEELILLSPTGSGKTLAFLLPLFERMDPGASGIQALVLVPSRELALQIEQVARDLGTGFKIGLAYGGRGFAKDLEELRHPPALWIGTPGRVADHLKRESVSLDEVQTLVLDEFDKALEVGFAKEMEAILTRLPGLERKILTSATQGVSVPGFVGLQRPKRLDFVDPKARAIAGMAAPQIAVKVVFAEGERAEYTEVKTAALAFMLRTMQRLGQRGIVFCSFKDSLAQLGEALDKRGIAHGRFYGGMEQQDRERTLIRFRNGTHRVLLATDLAARGLDVPALDFILHFELPLKAHEFVHRNGRTARMRRTGTAYVLQGPGQNLPEFVHAGKRWTMEEWGHAMEQDLADGEDALPEARPLSGMDWEDTSATPAADAAPRNWTTLFVSGGRKDKISKGDLAGFFFKEGGLQKDELGLIELKVDCAFVAVPPKAAKELVERLNNRRLKTKKVRVRFL